MEALHQVDDIIAQRYRILDILGQGGVGITYKAQDLKSGQQVAVKALSLRQMGDWKILELFEREAKILSKLNHPAIPRYLDYFQVDTPEDRSYYIVQELAEGKSLAALAEMGWRTNESGVRRIATQILEILVYLHELKPPVVHRDIKPQNLVWGQNAKVFLVDFGAVQDTYRSTFAKGSTIIGTYGYMAPEQFLGQAVPATDLYGLGATILFLLTHRSPSDLPQERLKISFRSRIQVSEGFADWLEKMLEPDVENRFSSAKQALEALHGRKVIAKSKLRWSVPWKALAGVGVAAVAAITILNFFKWAVLGAIGFQPTGICETISRGDIASVKDYFDRGGTPYAYDNDTRADTKDTPSTLIDCALHSGREDIAKLMLAKIRYVNTNDDRGRTFLHLATVLQRKNIAEQLIISGADVNTKDSWGKTPLHYVRSTEMAELLIAKGADVNSRDKDGKTPLYSVDSKEVAELLIVKGADVNPRDKDGKTPLYSVDSKKVAELLITKGADVNARTQPGETPLQSAVYRGNKDIVELLIAKGANVNVKTQYGETLLQSAVYRGNKDIVELLIAKGANVNVKTQYGETVLQSAVSSGNKDIVELLIAKGANVNVKTPDGETLLQSAVYRGNKDIVELLVTKGANVNVKTPDGETLLQSAVYRGNKDIVELLIAKGANVNVRDKDGTTLQHYVSSKEVAELLIAKGADVNARDKDGKTPLHYVSSKEVAEILIANGADVNARDKDGKSPLHYARSKEVAEVLIANGADVNAMTQYGETPLHSVHSEEVVKLLITNGANVKARTYGSTALHLAVFKDNKDLAELLIAKGADVKARDAYGQTPLHSVCSQEMTELMIAKGADVNARNGYGRTPLHSVILHNCNNDFNKQSYYGGGYMENYNESLLRAGRFFVGSKEVKMAKEVAELLIANGADVNARDNQGKTPLHSVRLKEMAELLIGKGADVNARDNTGSAPLHFIASKEMVVNWSTKGSGVNARNNGSSTSLSLGRSYSTNKDIVELLIAKGADVNATSSNGSTPLHQAVISKHWNMVELLKSYGGIE